MTINSPEQQDTIDPRAVVAHLADLLDRIDRLQREADVSRRLLADLLPEGNHTFGGAKVTVYVPRRFDKSKAEMVLTPEEKWLCSRPVVDSALARDALSPRRYAECQVEGRRTVRIS